MQNCVPEKKQAKQKEVSKKNRKKLGNKLCRKVAKNYAEKCARNVAKNQETKFFREVKAATNSGKSMQKGEKN